MATTSHNPWLLRGGLALSRHFRARRRDRFLRYLPVTGDMHILDLGGAADWVWGDWPEGAPRMTVLNLDVSPRTEERVTYVRGDARDLSRWPDQAFDLVFSNSVIEHVGDWNDQQRMAAEIRRVGKAYWVQTPNRHFPIEPHMLFPFFQYLPLSWRRWLGPRWPFSFEKMRQGDPLRDAVGVRLMTRREVQHCFPDGEVLAERLCGWVKSWIAVRRA